MKKKALCILLACAMTFSSFAGVNLTAYATDVADAAAETDEAEEADAADVTEETDAADTAADATDEADEVIQTEEVVENYATDAMMASVPADALYEWDFEEADGSATIRTTTGNESPIMSVSENQEVASTFFGEAGKVGRAIVFNGGATGKYVNLDLQKNVEKDTSWSAAAWIKTRANGSMVLLSSNDNTDGKAKGAIKPGVAGGETLQGKGYVKYGVGEYRLGEQGDYLPQNVWSHVVYVCDAATDTMTLYVNGVRCDSHNVYIDAPLQRLGAGCNVPQATDKMNASVDELKVYGRALSATEVAGLYNSYNTATEVPDLPITVESRYASTRISWEDVAATSYDVYRVVGLKDTAENAETDDVKVGTVAQGVGTCVDDFADLGMTAATINNYVGRTDSYYVVASYIETEGAEPEVIARTSAPKADKYATGLEAVQKHAAEEQFHVDLTYTADVADGRTFANNRVYSAAEAEINRIKDLTEGTIMVTFQSDGYADTPETLYTLKNTAFNATSYDSGAHISVSQNGATSLRPYFGGGLKWGPGITDGKWNTFSVKHGTSYAKPAGTFEIQGMVANDTQYTNNVGFDSSGTDFDLNYWPGFLTRTTQEINSFTIGATVNGNTVVRPYTGKIAYVTVTDELFTEPELKAYSIAASTEAAKEEPIVTLKVEPTKTTYKLNEVLDTEGIVVKKVFTDAESNTTELVVDNSKLSFTYDFTSAGSRNVTVSLDELSTTFNVTVEDTAVTGIEIVKLPKQLEYVTTDTGVNTEGLEIRVTYDDGETAVINASDAVTVTGLDGTVGPKTITVTYKGQTTTYQVNVRDGKLMQIGNDVLQPRATASSWAAGGAEGHPRLAFDGVLNNHWHSAYSGSYGGGDTNGAATQAHPVWIQTGFGQSKLLKKIEYKGRTVGNTANKINNYAIAVANLSDPNAVPTDADFGIVKTGTTNNELDVTVTLDYAVKATHVRLIAYDVGSTDKHVAISEMKVYEAEPFDLQSIQITTPPTKTEYLPTEVGTVDTTGMVVKGSYADGTVCEIASADLEIGTLSATEGTQSVTVSYGGKSTSYDVVVKSEVTKLKETLLEKIQALQAQIDLEVYDNEYLNNVLAEAETVYKEATELAAVQAQIDALDALTYTFKTDAEATGVYLSDLEWVSDSAPLASGGHTHKDEHQSGATPIRLTDATGEEVEFKKGLGSHAAQTTVYNLNGEYDIFESYIGVDNAAGEFNGVIFKVYVDCLPTDEGAKPVYTSKVLNRGDAMEHLLVDVKGANKLVLVADSNGDVSGDHADWAAARLYTNYKLDVTEFKSGETVTCPEAPAGQVFAGWFNEKAFATAYKQGTGSAWPKFIDEEVLSTKIQCSAGAEVGDPNTNMRFITTVDDLNYSSVGFEITINDITLQKNSTTVYEKIYANIGSTTEEKSPDTFYEDSKFFFTYIINNIPQVGFDNDIVVIPYVVTLDGTTSYGVERTLTVASHLASIAEPAN